jgi:hypothetical protein
MVLPWERGGLGDPFSSWGLPGVFGCSFGYGLGVKDGNLLGPWALAPWHSRLCLKSSVQDSEQRRTVGTTVVGALLALLSHCQTVTSASGTDSPPTRRTVHPPRPPVRQSRHSTRVVRYKLFNSRGPSTWEFGTWHSTLGCTPALHTASVTVTPCRHLRSPAPHPDSPPGNRRPPSSDTSAA